MNPDIFRDPEVRKVARDLNRLKRQVRMLGSASQAAYRSSDGTANDEDLGDFDDDGEPLDDNDNPAGWVPPTPTVPDTVAKRGAVDIVWDGTFEDAEWSSSIEAVQIHILTNALDEPEDATIVGTFGESGGIYNYIWTLQDPSVFVVLRAISVNGVVGAWSFPIPVLPLLGVDPAVLAELNEDLYGLNNETLPALNADLTNLNDVVIPALNTNLNNLNTVTIPALNADLATLNNTTIPNLNTSLSNLNSSLAVTQAKFPINTADLADLAISSAKLGTGAVVNDKILDSAVSNAKVSDNAISALKIADNAVGSTKISDNAVGSTKILDDAIITDKIATGAVIADTIASAAVITDKIITDAISADKIAANAVDTAELNANSVNSFKITTNAVDSDEINANAVNSLKIVTNAVAADEIATNAISTDEMSANSVAADEISTNSISTDEMLTNSVAADEITSNSISTDEMLTNSVSTDELVANSVQSDEIIANAIGADELAAGAVTAEDISSKTITSMTLTSSSISTAPSGQRAELNSSWIAFYSSTGVVQSYLGGSFEDSRVGGILTRRNGNTFTDGRLLVSTGGLYVLGTFDCNGDIDMKDLYKITGVDNISLDYNGMTTGDNTTGDNLRILGTGRIFRTTSSRRYKHNIVDMDVNVDAAYNLEPRRYWRIDTNSPGFGFIAEEASELGLVDYVTYDASGAPTNFNYEMFSAVAHQAMLRDLRQRVRDLEFLLTGRTNNDDLRSRGNGEIHPGSSELGADAGGQPAVAGGQLGSTQTNDRPEGRG